MLKLLCTAVSSGSKEPMFSKAVGGEEEETKRDTQWETVNIISLVSSGLCLLNEKLVL